MAGPIGQLVGTWFSPATLALRRYRFRRFVLGWKLIPTKPTSSMWKNPSYVFFRTLPGLADDQGAPGALGVPLTAGHSLAVDRTVWPLGVPMWLDTVYPAEVGGAPLRTLAIAQDTGGAIKGAVRADLFLGAGPAAEQIAGAMKSDGRLWVLLPKGVEPVS